MGQEGASPAGDREEARTRVTAVPADVEFLNLEGKQTLIPEYFVSPEGVKDQRDSPQTKAGLTLEVILIDEPGQPTVPIKLRDTSRGGMGFFSRHGFKVGDRIAVRFHFANAKDRLVLYQVRHCTALGADWHQGGMAFVEAVSQKGRELVIPRRWVKGSGP